MLIWVSVQEVTALELKVVVLNLTLPLAVPKPTPRIVITRPDLETEVMALLVGTSIVLAAV